MRTFFCSSHSGMLETAQARSQEPTVHISFQLHVSRCLPGSSKVAIVGVCTHRKQQNNTLGLLPKAVVKCLPIHNTPLIIFSSGLPFLNFSCFCYNWFFFFSLFFSFWAENTQSHMTFFYASEDFQVSNLVRVIFYVVKTSVVGRTEWLLWGWDPVARAPPSHPTERAQRSCYSRAPEARGAPPAADQWARGEILHELFHGKQSPKKSCHVDVLWADRQL